jgi:hypothetical protein
MNANQGDDPNQLNQFAYCQGNPFMYVDPTGVDGDTVKSVHQAEANYEKS